MTIYRFNRVKNYLIMSENPQTEFETNISKTYTVKRFKLDVPSVEQAPTTPIFSSPQTDLLNSIYNPVGKVPNFPTQLPDPMDSSSYQDFLLKIQNWKEQFVNFSQTAEAPIPINHSLPRPTPPQIISAEEWADNTIKRRLIRNFKAETSPLTPPNFIDLFNTFNKGDSIDLESAMPNKGLNDSDILYKYHLNEKVAWSSTLIPTRTQPTFYSSFEDYEAAMLSWGNHVDQLLTVVPPNAEQIGDLLNLKQEGDVDLAPPPPPPLPINRFEPLNSSPVSEEPLSSNLAKLTEMYDTNVLSPCYMSTENPRNNESTKLPKYDERLPSHVEYSKIKSIVKEMINVGVPISPEEMNDSEKTAVSLTRIMRLEKSIKDAGLMAQTDRTARYCSSSRPRERCKSKSSLAISDILKNGVASFLLTDYSPKQMSELLKLQSPNGKTIAEDIFNQMPLSEIIQYSFYSEHERFLSKFAVIITELLQYPQYFETITKLDLPNLERLVELVQFTTYYSFPMECMPDVEVSAVLQEDNNSKIAKQILGLTMSFRQAQLVYLLYCATFSGPQKHPKFLPFMRDLIHKSHQKIISILDDETLFNKILDHYFSTSPLIHKFHYRLLRTIILLQYTKIIRTFGSFDLISFFQRGLSSPDIDIQRDTMSLWMLILHTDTSMALQLQIIQVPPSSIVSLMGDESPLFKEFLLSIFSLFRETKSMFQFAPFPFNQFQGYINILPSETNSEAHCMFLHCLLSLCSNRDVIYCNREGDFVGMINKFSSTALLLIKNPTLMKMKCLKALYRIRSLETQSYSIPEVWDFILTEMARKGEIPIDYRLAAWFAFRNAMLNQKNFMSFIRNNENLSKKLDAIFASYDEKVLACMVPTLTTLALPLIRSYGIDDRSKTNLTEFFNFLIEKEELIAAKLIMASKVPHVSVEASKMHSFLDQFFKVLLKADKHSVLRNLLNQKHFKTGLSDLFKKVAYINNLSYD